MNDDDPKPSVVIDVTPENEPDTQPSDEASRIATEEPSEEKVPNRGSGVLGLVVAVIALIGAGVIAFLGYQQTQTLDGRLVAIEARLAKSTQAREALQQAVAEANDAVRSQSGALDQQRGLLEQQRLAVDEARTAFEAQERRLAEESLQLQEREAELRAAVADVHRRVGRSGTQWMLAETEYLLRLASHRLNLARDTQTAQVALELADQRLRDTQDPGWAGVRSQIARDIASLGAFEPPDAAGMAARLAATIEQVPQLQIARATIGAERTLPERVTRDPAERSWDTLFEDLWGGFKDAVRIRERDKPVAAMLAPEHQFFLYENLKLHLEGARLALARGDETLFLANLDTAADWVSRYFAADGVATSITETIDALRAVDIRPAVPDVSQSLRALQARQKLLDDIVPPDPAPAASATTQ